MVDPGVYGACCHGDGDLNFMGYLMKQKMCPTIQIRKLRSRTKEGLVLRRSVKVTQNVLKPELQFLDLMLLL